MNYLIFLTLFVVLLFVYWPAALGLLIVRAILGSLLTTAETTMQQPARKRK